MADRSDQPQPQTFRFLLGVGFDEENGHARVTKGEDFVILGGSEDTHTTMQDHVEQFHDTLQKMGTDLQRATDDEVVEAAHESGLIED